MGYTYVEDNQDGERLQSHNYPELLLRYGLLADWLEFRLGWVYANEVLTNGTLRTSIDGSRDLYVGAKIALTPQAGIFPEMAITPQALVRPRRGVQCGRDATRPQLALLMGRDGGLFHWGLDPGQSTIGRGDGRTVSRICPINRSRPVPHREHRNVWRVVRVGARWVRRRNDSALPERRRDAGPRAEHPIGRPRRLRPRREFSGLLCRHRRAVRF